MIPASPAKLRSGAWGARVRDPDVSVGAHIQITTKAGKSWPAEVTAVVARYADAALVATRSLDTGHTPAKTRASTTGCPRCCRTPTRRAQIWEECDWCGAEPVYI